MMKTSTSILPPLVVLAFLWVCGGASLVWSAEELPAKVASHFDGDGKPNGWMARDDYLRAMAAVGVLMPLFLLGIGLSMRVLPASSINLPRREYWLAPERRAETTRYLARHMAWLACCVTAFFIAINWLAIEGNRQAPPRLSNVVWMFLALFLIAVTVWIVVLIVHFSKTPTAEESVDAREQS